MKSLSAGLPFNVYSNLPISCYTEAMLDDLNSDAHSIFKAIKRESYIYLANEERLQKKLDKVKLYESQINKDEPLYLITWAPNPKDLLDSDFITQHEYNINILSDYIQACEYGLFCVETTQAGNPHYHGWYQVSNNPLRESERIAIVKTMQRFGLVKITKSKGHYKINSYNSHANCLHYYKYDMLGPMAFVEKNPICFDTRSTIDWNDMSYARFFNIEGKRQTVADLEDKMTLRDFYKDFYKKSN